MLDKPVEEKFSVLQDRPKSRRVGLVQYVVNHLRHLIESGAIGTGEKLPTEASLISDLQVSRSVVREAISQLQAAGLAQTKHGIGTFVSPASVQASDDLLGQLEASRAEVKWLKSRVEQLEELLTFAKLT